MADACFHKVVISQLWTELSSRAYRFGHC